MPAPELTLRTSGITWRTEGYDGPDNDVRLTALGELYVDGAAASSVHLGEDQRLRLTGLQQR
jgi:hypothetical protein